MGKLNDEKKGRDFRKEACDLLRRCLLYHMNRTGMKQEDIEKVGGLSQSTVSCALNGKHSTQLGKVMGMASAFGLALDEFLRDPQKMNRPKPS